MQHGKLPLRYLNDGIGELGELGRYIYDVAAAGSVGLLEGYLLALVKSIFTNQQSQIQYERQHHLRG